MEWPTDCARGCCSTNKQFPAGKFDLRPAQTNNHLKRKKDFPVQILMQAVEIARLIAQQQRSRPHLAGSGALFHEAPQLVRIFLLPRERRRPFSRRAHQLAVQLAPERVYLSRQWIVEILIFAPAKAIPGHIDTAPKKFRLRIKRTDAFALALIE